MQNDIPMTFAGNLTADPEIRFTDSGRAVCSFTVASTPRRQVNGEWKDGEVSFVRCAWFGPGAENFAESFGKGDRVIVIGKMVTRRWKDQKTGEDRSAFQVDVTEAGGSVQYATVQVRKARRNGHDDVPPPVDPYTGESATETVQSGK